MKISDAIRDLTGILYIQPDSVLLNSLLPDIIELFEALDETTYTVLCTHGVSTTEFNNLVDAIDYCEKQARNLYSYSLDEVYWEEGILSVKSDKHDLFRVIPKVRVT